MSLIESLFDIAEKHNLNPKWISEKTKYSFEIFIDDLRYWVSAFSVVTLTATTKQFGKRFDYPWSELKKNREEFIRDIMIEIFNKKGIRNVKPI